MASRLSHSPIPASCPTPRQKSPVALDARRQHRGLSSELQLLAAALVSVIGIRQAMLLSFIPGVLAAVAITVAPRRVRRTLAESTGRRTLTLNLGELRRAGLARVLTPVVLFELGNAARRC